MKSCKHNWTHQFKIIQNNSKLDTPIQNNSNELSCFWCCSVSRWSSLRDCYSNLDPIGFQVSLGCFDHGRYSRHFGGGYRDFCDASAKLHWLNLYFGDLQRKFGDSGTLGAYVLCVIQCACAPFWAFCNDVFAVWWWAREPFKGVVSRCFMLFHADIMLFLPLNILIHFAHLSRLRFVRLKAGAAARRQDHSQAAGGAQSGAGIVQFQGMTMNNTMNNTRDNKENLMAKRNKVNTSQ